MYLIRNRNRMFTSRVYYSVHISIKKLIDRNITEAIIRSFIFNDIWFYNLTDYTLQHPEYTLSYIL